VASDGLSCFNDATVAGRIHQPIVVGSGKVPVARPELRWVNMILGSIKNGLRGAYHAIGSKYAQRHLVEFEYRFHRRIDLPDIAPSLAYGAPTTTPMLERLIKLRLV